jgi:cleavage and polyadenylation specificity factor subunit 2
VKRKRGNFESIIHSREEGEMLQVTSLSCLPHNCLLLTLDSLSILLNASTPDSLPPANLPSHLDFILLSHSTVPISTLGRLSTLESTPPGATVTDVKSDEEYEYLTPKDVEKVFDRIKTVRYSQPVILGHGVTVTAYPAGHTIGGTIWNLRKDQENVVVMLGWNHAKERIVRGMLDVKTLRLLERASCVITDVRGSSIPQVPTRKVREQFLIGNPLFSGE